MTDPATQGTTPFHDLDGYIAMPRLSGLELSPDGSRLVTGVQTLDPERTAYRTALWEVDPAGERPARRLTRNAKGGSATAFTSQGDLLFTSARPDPDAPADGKDEPEAALWLLPAAGGEARVIATAPGGIRQPLAARDAPVVSVAASVLPSARDLEHDQELRKARTEHKARRSSTPATPSGTGTRTWVRTNLGGSSPTSARSSTCRHVRCPMSRPARGGRWRCAS